jgi:hypothetical protein
MAETDQAVFVLPTIHGERGVGRDSLWVLFVAHQGVHPSKRDLINASTRSEPPL